MFSKRIIDWLVLGIYTIINLWILFYFLFGGWIFEVATLHQGNLNLIAIFVGLFLNIALVLYSKLINRKLEGLLLIIYSYLNIRVAFPFLSRGALEEITLVSDYGSTHNLLAIILGIFLNAALIIYWARKNINRTDT